MDSRKKIIQKASELFQLQGAKTVTMDEVANLCGISKKTLYQYFPNKESLLLFIIDEMNLELENLMNSIKELNLNPIEELLTTHYKIQSIIKSENDVFMYQLSKYYPKAHQKCYHSKFKTFYNFIYTNIENGKKLGLYKPEIHSELISKIFFSTSISIKTLDIFKNMDMTLIEMKKSLLHFYISGLLTKQGTEIFNAYITNNEN